MEKNQSTFGKPKYGLHGKALPNFFYKSNSVARIKSLPVDSEDAFASVVNDIKQSQQTTVEWWKTNPGYQEKPRNVSCQQLNRQKKYWAKPDNLYLNAFKTEEAPIDDFKKSRQIKLNPGKDDELHWDKPNSFPLPDDLDALSHKVTNSQYKNNAVPKTDRFSEKYAFKNTKEQVQGHSHEAYFANKPVYSSFA